MPANLVTMSAVYSNVANNSCSIINSTRITNISIILETAPIARYIHSLMVIVFNWVIFFLNVAKLLMLYKRVQ